MPAEVAVYHDVQERIEASVSAGVPKASRPRLSLLVTGILTAKSVVVAQMASAIEQLEITRATQEESVARRFRRALNDEHLQGQTCYAPALAQVIDWTPFTTGAEPLLVLVDESSQTDAVHLFRVSLPYRGGALPLAWATWAQNTALPEGTYWREVDHVLAQVAALVPAGHPPIAVADGAYAIPSFVDRLGDLGWPWIVRVRLAGSHRLRDERGQEWALSAFVHQHLGRRGRWKGRVEVFKGAGWRSMSLVAVWAAGAEEPLVVLSDLPPDWTLLRHYDRRFWIEPSFRNDKSRGWQWEASQVQGAAHHAVLLLAMAWATLLTLCLGAVQAQRQLDRLDARPLTPAPGRTRLGRPRHARASLFTMGLRSLLQWPPPDVPFPWHLPHLTDLSWFRHWHRVQAWRYIFQPVRP